MPPTEPDARDRLMSTLKVMALLAAAVALREYQHRPAPRPAGETRVAAAPAVAFGP